MPGSTINRESSRQRGGEKAKKNRPLALSILRKSFSGFEEGVSFYFCGAVVFLMVLLVCGEVFARAALSTSILGVVEIVELSMIVITFVSLGGIQREKGHIRMELVVNKLMKGRPGPIMEAFNMLISVAMFAIFCYAGIQYTLYVYEGGEITTWLKLIMWPVAMCLPIGSFLLCIRCATQLREYLKMLK